MRFMGEFIFRFYSVLFLYPTGDILLTPGNPICQVCTKQEFAALIQDSINQQLHQPLILTS